MLRTLMFFCSMACSVYGTDGRQERADNRDALLRVNMNMMPQSFEKKQSEDFYQDCSGQLYQKNLPAHLKGHLKSQPVEEPESEEGFFDKLKRVFFS